MTHVTLNQLSSVRGKNFSSEGGHVVDGPFWFWWEGLGQEVAHCKGWAGDGARTIGRMIGRRGSERYGQEDVEQPLVTEMKPSRGGDMVY